MTDLLSFAPVSPVWPVVAALACWRITRLLNGEDGPWRMFARLRSVSAGTVFGEALACFQCLSLFVAAPLALWVGPGWGARLLLWPALSAGAILLERGVFPETFIETPDYHEDEEA